MNPRCEQKMFGALLAVMDALEQSGLALAGKYAVLDAATGKTKGAGVDGAEALVSLRRAAKLLQLSALQKTVVLRIAERWVGGEWPALTLLQGGGVNELSTEKHPKHTYDRSHRLQ